MASVVGIAIEGTVVRAVYRERGRLLHTEHAWDGIAIERVVDALRSEIGAAQSLILSVGLGFLEVTKPHLPPMSDGDRRRVLMRDADRYFPLEGALAISSPAASMFAYATSSEQLQRWVRAFEEWAPVRGVVPAPIVLASVIASSGSYVIDAGVAEQGLLQTENQDVRDVRRVPQSSNAVQTNGATSLRSDARENAANKYAAADGVLNFANAPLETMLLDSALEATLRSARMRRQWMSYAFAIAAMLAVFYSANARRDATLRATQHAVDSLATLAVPGLAAKSRLTQLSEEARILSSSAATGRDPLHVLAALSESLPRDAFVERLAWDGSEWQLSGSVNQAATVVPHLDSARIFSNVRVLGASNRFRDGARMRETFAVAFKITGDPVVRR